MFIALALEEDNWYKSVDSGDGIVKLRIAMRKLLKENPPNLVIVKDVPTTDSGYYGIHYRQKSLWQFICVNEVYVNGWIASTRESELGLSYAALLDAVIDHELSHWLITLVSNVPYPYISLLKKKHVTEIWLPVRRISQSS